MADFCLDCTKEMFPGAPEGENDCKNYTTPEDTQNKIYAIVLCEGCGWIKVDHTGKRVEIIAE